MRHLGSSRFASSSHIKSADLRPTFRSRRSVGSGAGRRRGIPRRLGRVHQRDAKTRCLQSCGRSTELSALLVGSSTICPGAQAPGMQRLPSLARDVASNARGDVAMFSASAVSLPGMREAPGPLPVARQCRRSQVRRARWSTELAYINVHVWPWRPVVGG